jgi:hypothetical protein
VYFDEKIGGSDIMLKDMMMLTLGDGTHMVFPYQPGNKLPMMLTSPYFNNPIIICGLTFEDTNMLSNLMVANEVNQNLTAATKELLIWHWNLGHADMQCVQIMIQTHNEGSHHNQILYPKVNTPSSCEHPLCATCHFDKPTRKNPGTIQGGDSSNRDLSHGDLKP